MADFDIKPASGTGNSLRLKNEAGNIVLSTNNGTGASSWGTVPPAGTILQVQSTTLTTGYTASNASWTDITGLSVSITPKLDTSKILILASINITASNDHRSRLMRGSTPIAVGTGQASSQSQMTFGFHYNSAGAFVETRSMNFLDSPATTSATTYKIQAEGTSAVFVNRSSTDTDNSSFGRSVSTITVMEVSV